MKTILKQKFAKLPYKEQEEKERAAHFLRLGSNVTKIAALKASLERGKSC